MTFKLYRCSGQQLHKRVCNQSRYLQDTKTGPSERANILRHASTATVQGNKSETKLQEDPRNIIQNGNWNSNTHAHSLIGQQAQQKEADREFFADLLSSAATKRDAKAYLSRLKSPVKSSPPVAKLSILEKGTYVNLGGLFPGRPRVVEQSPVFSQAETKQEEGFQESEEIHVALVKISGVAGLKEDILKGVGETLAQLNRLSISPLVVLEGNPGVSRVQLNEEADKLVSAIGSVASKADNVFGTDLNGSIDVVSRKLLMRPLRRGQILVVSSVAFNRDDQRMTIVPAGHALLAIVKELNGTKSTPAGVGEQRVDETGQTNTQKEVSLDRLITIDSAGGIPNERAVDGRHVFLNLEQEYGFVKQRLEARTEDRTARIQLSNLNLLQEALHLLPPTSSGLMTTYEEAANVRPTSNDHETNGVGTRRQKNTLIHNLLTDKPAYSSSLPLGRLTHTDDYGDVLPVASRSSFVKRGMPLTIFPNPFQEPWKATSPRLKLTDSRIDLGKLVHLIEDSFGRALDVDHYLTRVNDIIAGVIIVGNYEGGAILTWETPPENPSADPVPYLDKFAVLRRSQGAGGVADIVFNAMVRSCFPKGVCWRSRGGNPVNKWYMERSRGTWKLSKEWTMFWTTPEVEMNSRRFKDYEGVCRGVKPSWADRQKPAD